MFSHRALAPGTPIGGDYKVLRPLGEGAMGAVYVVEQLSTGVPRALKIMHGDVAKSESFRRRFAQEARACAQIPSDHVIAVLGAGIDEELAIPWIAMELLEGETLDGRIDGGEPMPLPEVLDLFRALCHALGAAHELGIVHRDIKPRNIFLARSKRPGEPYTPKLLDFGIAKLTGDAQANATAAVGTPLWMAPEQTTARAKIGPQADVWALGLLAFYVLTGKRYWLTAHDEDTSIAALMREITVDPIEAAPVRAGRLGVGSRIPLGFDAWFDRCMRREPDERFANANRAFDLLGAVLTGNASNANRVLESTQVAPDVYNPFATAPPLPTPTAVVPEPTPHGSWPFVGPSAVSEMRQAGASADVAAPTIDTNVVRSRRWPLVIGALVVVGVVGGILWSPWTNRSGVPSTREIAEAAEVAKGLPMHTFAATTYSVGSDTGPIDERPMHIASMATFSMDLYEVPVESYERCVAVGHCMAAATGEFCNAGRTDDRQRHPINCVDHGQAKAFCAWLGRRLPSEQEWE
ncbi:MAG: protein kinase, partial [Myxococcales bacterium]